MEDARSRHRKPCLVVGIALALGMLLPGWARAQQAAPPTNPTPIELAKSVHNPFEDFVKVVQATTGFNLGNHHDAGEGREYRTVGPGSANRAVGPDGAAQPYRGLPADPQFAIRAHRPAVFFLPDAREHQ